MGHFFFQEIHLTGLLLVILLGELMLFLDFRLEDVSLPGGVTGIFTMKRAIQLGMMLLEFLTMIFFGLEVLFLPLGVTFLV